MQIIIAVMCLLVLVGIYGLSSAVYERMMGKKASYGCDGGCAGCRRRGSCSDNEKGGH